MDYEKNRKWADLVYDDSFYGECGLCACEEPEIMQGDIEHVLCPVCGFCLKYHCECEVL